MHGPLYIRVLGRVKGPFEWEKLRILVKRGQLSRIHEVSVDGQAWVKDGRHCRCQLSSLHACYALQKYFRNRK